MNTRLRCLLLDDELPGLALLKMLCQDIPELEVVKAFNNPEIFLREISSLQFDLVILDVEMPVINGVQVANSLKGTPVIFTTAYKEFAADAFDLNAVDYVLKPIRKERLYQAVLKAVNRISGGEQRQAYAQLNSDAGKTILFFDHLKYISTSPVDSRDKVARLYDGSVVTLKNISFDKLIKLLPGKNFLRINKKDILAKNIIRSFTQDEVTTTILQDDGRNMKFPLSETYRAAFLDWMKD